MEGLAALNERREAEAEARRTGSTPAVQRRKQELERGQQQAREEMLHDIGIH